MVYCREIPPLSAIIPMKSYDDLQRFKEKTQTNHIEFKDMSEQTKNSDSANWAIIKQLMNDGAESALGNGQRIDVPAPQPIAEDTFIATSAQRQPVSPPPVKQPRPQPAAPSHARAQPHSIASLVAKPAATQIGASLLDSISASLKPAPVAEPTQPEASALVQAVNPFTETQTVNPLTSAQPAPAANPLASAQPASAHAAAQPAASPLMSSLSSLPTAPPAPVRQPAAAASVHAELPRFKQLFSTTPDLSATSLSKETLLQPLLERIASCR
ncbi:cellulose biosynthesis protein BcsO [Erwinia sp.]|uniref:cellulose biosynthesis protein BcsO n=1 Tax=Erwinia citreus TaxID=558 RepID=UPI003C783195